MRRLFHQKLCNVQAEIKFEEIERESYRAYMWNLYKHDTSKLEETLDRAMLGHSVSKCRMCSRSRNDDDADVVTCGKCDRIVCEMCKEDDVQQRDGSTYCYFCIETMKEGEAPPPKRKRVGRPCDKDFISRVTVI